MRCRQPASSSCGAPVTGLSTIELAATVALIAVALAPLLGALRGSLQSATTNQRYEMAADLAASRMARLHATPFTQLVALDGHTESPPRDRLGRPVPQAADMTLLVRVAAVSAEDPGGPALPPGTTPILRLTVSIAWAGATLELTSLQARLLDSGD